MARFIVTGTPRSATGYASSLFQELAIPCSHERIFKPRGALADVLDWYEHKDAGESSWLAWAFLGLLPGKVPVLHTMRNPWAVVDSLAYRNNLLPSEMDVDRHKKKLRDAAKAYCPEAFEYPDALNRAAAFVLRWNQLITDAVVFHQCPYKRYRVEELGTKQVDSLLRFIGEYRDSYEIDAALRSVPRNVNRGMRLQYRLQVINPVVLDALERASPGHDGIVTCAKTVDTPRTPAELTKNMEPQLAEAVHDLATEQGYGAATTADVPIEEGVLTHGTR